MTTRWVPIIPRGPLLTLATLQRALENGLTAVAKGVKTDFDVTTQTWRNRPTFAIDKAKGERTVSTDDPIYGYVDRGTRPHIITPKSPDGVLVFGSGKYKAKTKVRVIGSTSGGGSGAPVFAHAVQHPGTEAREFRQVIAEKWERKMPEIMQAAINAGVR